MIVRAYLALVSILLLAACGASVTAGGRQGNDDLNQIERSVNAGSPIRAIGIFRADYQQPAAKTLPVKIVIEDQGGRTIHLALASYFPVRWEVSGPGAGSVEGVYLAGYHGSSITGLPNAHIQNLSGPLSRRSDTTPPQGGWGSTWGSKVPVPCAVDLKGSRSPCTETEDFIANAEHLLNAKLGSFSGIDQASSFTIKALP